MLHFSTYVIKENYPDQHKWEVWNGTGFIQAFCWRHSFDLRLWLLPHSPPLTWVLKDQITLPLSTAEDTKHCLYPSLWFLDLLPPRAACWFYCCPVSFLHVTLTRSICPSCWIWEFYFIIESGRHGLSASQPILPLASSTAEKDWTPTHSWASPSDWAQ